MNLFEYTCIPETTISCACIYVQWPHRPTQLSILPVSEHNCFIYWCWAWNLATQPGGCYKQCIQGDLTVQFCNHGNSPKSAQPTLGSKTTFVAQQPRSSHQASEMLNKKILLILQMPTSSFLGRFDEISGGGRHLCIGRFHKESIIGTFHLTSLMSVVLELKDVWSV